MAAAIPARRRQRGREPIRARQLVFRPRPAPFLSAEQHTVKRQEQAEESAPRSLRIHYLASRNPDVCARHILSKPFFFFLQVSMSYREIANKCILISLIAQLGAILVNSWLMCIHQCPTKVWFGGWHTCQLNKYVRPQKSGSIANVFLSQHG